MRILYLKNLVWVFCLQLIFFSSLQATSVSLNNLPSIDGALASVISGKVTSASTGEPIPGVNIKVKGTTNGTITDIDGDYNLDVQQTSGAVLVFSYVGYSTQEIEIGSRNVINVALQDDARELDNIVVTGYESVVKGEVTGSIVSVKGDQVANIPVSSVDAAFQGKLAGVMVQQSSGQPGSAVQVRVRGFSSIGAGSEPLYVIDGVPMKTGSFGSLAIDGDNFDGSGGGEYDGNVGTNALADINPNDIESIEVLKDASEAAIYGARASNGVILITTKKGKKGPAQFNFDTYVGTQSLSRKLEYMDTESWADSEIAAAVKYLGVDPDITYDEYWNGDGTMPWRADGNTDWQDVITHAAPVINSNLSMRGGSDDFTYSGSLGYFDQDGITLGTSYQRINTRWNLDLKANEKIRVGANFAYAYSYRDATDEGPRFNGVFYRGLGNNPLMNTHIVSQEAADASGLEIGDLAPERGNSLRVLKYGIYDTYTDRTNANVYVNYEPIEGLSIRSNIALDLLTLKQDNFLPSEIIRNNNRQSASSLVLARGWINENVATYKTTVNDDHNLTFLAGLSLQNNRTEYLEARANQAASDLVYTVNAGANLLRASSSITEFSLISYFGRFKYNYRSKYLFAASLRSDGSSRFGSGNRFATFPAFSVGWNVAKEDFMANSIFDDLKFRASWGQTGNQEIANFVSQGLYLTGDDYMGIAGIGSAPNGLLNQGLGWETTTQSDIGVDMTLFQGRLSLSADYYLKDTEDLLFEVDLPNTTGYSSALTNLGKIRNSGVDLQLQATPFTSGDFTWTTRFNIGFLNNKVISLPGGNDVQKTERYLFGGVISILREGEELGSYYVYNPLKVISTSAEADAVTYEDKISTLPRPEAGDNLWQDVNGDNVIDVNDKIIYGSPIPDFTGGFDNTFTWKGLSLNVFLQFSKGNEVYNLFRQDLDQYFGKINTVDVYRAWEEEGDVTDIPRKYRLDPAKNVDFVPRPQTRFVEDASFIRIRNVTLAYQFPSKLIQGIGLRSLRVYATGQNLAVFTKYKGFDPEVNVAQINNSSQNGGFQFGIDRGLYPMSKTYTVGLSIGF